MEDIKVREVLDKRFPKGYVLIFRDGDVESYASFGFYTNARDSAMKLFGMIVEMMIRGYQQMGVIKKQEGEK